MTVEGGAGDARGIGAAEVTVGALRSLADWGAMLGCRQTAKLQSTGLQNTQTRLEDVAR